MSEDKTLSRTVNLSQQRKRAKELVKHFRAARSEAIARVEAHFPGATSLKLAQAQLVVACEAGFSSWARLKLRTTQLGRSRAELEASVLSAALRGHQLAIDSALELAPDLSRSSPHVAAALADEAALTPQLRASATAVAREPWVNTPVASQRASPHASQPSSGLSVLGYLCFARIGREHDAVKAARGRMARQLIEVGSDPKECVDTYETPGGKFSLLAAAARHAASSALVDVLLATGAELEPPGSTAGPPAPPLVAAAMGGNLDCVERLIAAGAPGWQAREALEVAVSAEDAKMARALLQYGASPDHAGRWQGRNGGCLHAALLLGRQREFLELLIEGGATQKSRDRDGRSPLQVAVQVSASPDTLELLVQHGASRDEIQASDELVGACVAGDVEKLEALQRRHPDLIQELCISDRQMVCWAVRHARHDALARMLGLGFDPNIRDDGGATALHLAVQHGDVPATRLLVQHGASAKTLDYENTTAVELALAEPDAELRRTLLECLRSSDACDPIATLLQGTGDSMRVAAPGDTPAQSDAQEINLPSGVDIEDFPEQLSAKQQALADAFEQAVLKMRDGDLDALRGLLDRDPALATARSPRYHRATLLHYLSSNGTEAVITPDNIDEMADLLLERGADVSASCRMYGGGPNQDTLGLAATSCHPEGAGLMDKLIGALVRGGALRNAPSGKNGALDGAILYGHRQAVDALAKHGVRPHDLASAVALGDLEAVNAELRKLATDPTVLEPSHPQLITAFSHAASLGRTPILERLLALGVDVNVRGEGGATALHRAAWANDTQVARWLLDRGADPSLKDDEHQGTPAGWAWHAGAKDLAELLVKAEGTAG